MATIRANVKIAPESPPMNLITRFNAKNAGLYSSVQIPIFIR